MTYSTNLQKRPLILPHEVREMRRDEQIIFAAAKPALRCGRAIFFRRPEMMEGLGKSRLREGAQSTAPEPTLDHSHDAELHAAFERLVSSAPMATMDDGAEATGFEGLDFEQAPAAALPPNIAESAVTTAMTVAAEAERAEERQRAAADQVFRVAQVGAESSSADADPATPPSEDPIATAEAMFARRPIGRGRR